MKLTNPYETTPEAQLHRTTIQVAGADKAFIVSLHNRKGTLQTTINHLLHTLVNELRKSNITSYDPDRYEHAVAGCSIHLGRGLPGSTQPTAPAQAVDRDDGCGLPGVALPASPSDNQRSVVAGAPKGQSRRQVRAKA